MKEISLTAEVRGKSGKGSARQARRAGKIPAVIGAPCPGDRLTAHFFAQWIDLRPFSADDGYRQPGTGLD